MISTVSGNTPAARRAVLLGFVLTLAAHYGWELLQARGFAAHVEAPLRAYAWHCFVAALGDVVIAGSCYAITALIFRARCWVLERRILPRALVWIAIGLAITIVLEIWATAVGRWAYAPTMPTIFGVGWLPIAQWLIVPSVTLGLLRIVLSRLGHLPQPAARHHNRW